MADQKPARVSKTKQDAKSKQEPKIDQGPKIRIPARQHLFWARELVQLARSEAVKKGVPDQVMAHAMLVNAWMLLTGQGEEDARKSVTGLLAASAMKKLNAPVNS